MHPPPDNHDQHIIDFIDAAVDSEELIAWLAFLEKSPENLRLLHLAEIKSQMQQNNEERKIINIVELLNNQEILHAMNAVINEVYDSGMRTNKFLNKNKTNYNLLLSLLAAL
ncbi:MAG: hypothetical protein KKB30_15350 [Proteobacteria bacterium]|nr:hypothetical protein [Pseudomonadota bacterium]MBU1716301.1 hypothetical protein [Pseudomonadota bacterium]